MPLWQPFYLHWLNIRCCRCSFLGRYICKTLIFAVADALFLTNVSATCFSLSLQILLSLPVMYNCICILSFLVFEDTSFTNFASSIPKNSLSQISPFSELNYIFPIILTIEYPYFSAVAHPVPAGFSFCPSHSTYGAHPFKTYSYLSSTHS